jgi:hypothetical protein
MEFLMRIVFAVFLCIFLTSCGTSAPKPGSPGEAGEPGSPGNPGPVGKPGSDAVISTISCSIDWNFESTDEIKRGTFLHYTVMTFSSGDVLAGLTRIYYNNTFSQKQNSTALWPKSYEARQEAEVGDSVFSAKWISGKAIFTLQATGEKKEVACGSN